MSDITTEIKKYGEATAEIKTQFQTKLDSIKGINVLLSTFRDEIDEDEEIELEVYKELCLRMEYFEKSLRRYNNNLMDLMEKKINLSKYNLVNHILVKEGMEPKINMHTTHCEDFDKFISNIKVRRHNK